MKNINAIINDLEKSLPPAFARKEVGRLTGGLVAPHTLANADAKGTGPAGRIRIGRHTAYSREDFLAWLRLRIKPAAKSGTSAPPVNVETSNEIALPTSTLVTLKSPMVPGT